MENKLLYKAFLNSSLCTQPKFQHLLKYEHLLRLGGVTAAEYLNSLRFEIRMTAANPNVSSSLAIPTLYTFLNLSVLQFPIGKIKIATACFKVLKEFNLEKNFTKCLVLKAFGKV